MQYKTRKSMQSKVGSVMLHKCLYCSTALVPLIMIMRDYSPNIERGMSVEKVMHLKFHNNYIWQCPKCGWYNSSEIASKVLWPRNYEEKCVLFRKNTIEGIKSTYKL